ncbi:hypothetical protein [Flavivirga aquatica]|uniref:hypothetical protein n=1 Tax=Flavivirga aquatica TaxID=1849968 RepID=UPI001F0A7588|nr:hypothetical protein [Flavivirga aquatica]
MDAIAERILTLNYHPISRFSDYLEISSIKEPLSLIQDTEMVNNLLNGSSVLLKQKKKLYIC